MVFRIGKIGFAGFDLGKVRDAQPVLEERFQLKWHHETRQLPVYYLSVNGPLKLQKTIPGSCRIWDPKTTPPAADPNQPPACGVWRNRVLPEGGRILEASGVTLAGLAGMMRNTVGREVVDSTGSQELFDVHLEFASLELGSAGGPPSGTAAPAASDRKDPPAASEPSELPSIFTVLKDVGLAVKPGRGPLEVFVVDSSCKQNLQNLTWLDERNP